MAKKEMDGELFDRTSDSEMGNLRNPLENLVKDIPIVSDYIKIFNVFLNILTLPLRTKASEGDFLLLLSAGAFLPDYTSITALGL